MAEEMNKVIRIEKDALGEMEIPGNAYWGIHTERALRNFPLSGRKVPAELIRAMAQVKQAAGMANTELGYLDAAKSRAVFQACSEIVQGALSDQFPLDALQGGAGTSTHMNVNEVITNRALEILGHPKGRYDILHPIEDINRHQSTNDVYPTALKIAAMGLLKQLSQEIAVLQNVFQKKEKEFASVIKIGRTECQEAVPITLGMEFSAFAEAVSRDRWRVFKCEERLRVTNIGGTAVGTGIGAPRRYIFLVIEKLREVTGLGLSRAENLAGETAFCDSFAEVSGIVKAHAANLIKIANDLRLMNLLGELHLPKAQVGSSIMPGKVNPVMLEAVMQAAMRVQAADQTIAECAGRGSFQINEFLPLLSSELLESFQLLIQTDRLFAGHADGIQADPDRCREYVNHSPGVLTALLPYVGYEKAGELVREMTESGAHHVRSFLEFKLGKELVDKILSPENLTQLGHTHDGKNT